MIKLIVDSTFGLSKEFVEKNDIEVVSLKVVIDNESYSVKYEDSWNNIYEKIENSKSAPSTSQPSPEDFINAIENHYKKDKDCEILILTISERLSGTINSANIAVNNFPNKKIVSLDSKQASTCGRIMVEEVCEKIKNGYSLNEIILDINKMCENLQIDFVPYTIDALKRGGRIGTLSATLANILHIKPVFRFKNGKINLLKKVFGFEKALIELIKQLPEKIKKLYVCYIQDNLNVEKLLNKVKQKSNKEIEVVALEPVFGVHVGKGSIGIASLNEY